MASLVYKTRLIVATALHEKTDPEWSAYVLISWRTTAGHREFHRIGTLAQRFYNPADAETFGLEVARAWIDEHF